MYLDDGQAMAQRSTPPVASASHIPPPVHEAEPPCQNAPSRTPTSAHSLETFRKQMEAVSDLSLESHNAPLEKAVKALGKAFADGALLREEIQGLLEQNDEKRSRKSLKRTVVGRGKIMSYEDIFAVREQRVEREAVKKGKQSSKRRKGIVMARREKTSPLSKEVQVAEAEMRMMGLEKYCAVLRF